MDQHYVISHCWWDVWIKLSSLPQYKMRRPGGRWVDPRMPAAPSPVGLSVDVWTWDADGQFAACRLPPIHHVRPSIFRVTRHQAPIQYSDPIQPSSEQMLITGSNTSLLTDIRSVAVRYFKISWEVSKNFQDSPSHQIFGHIHETLNVVLKNN